jgi:hypothetical protein
MMLPFTINGKDGNSYTLISPPIQPSAARCYICGLETNMKLQVTYADPGEAGLRATAIVVLRNKAFCNPRQAGDQQQRCKSLCRRIRYW